MKEMVFFALTVLLFSCGDKEESVFPMEKSITESVYASGTVESKNQYTAYASASGIVSQIYFAEGDAVQNGSPILSIASVTQQLNKENAQLLANFNDVSSNQGKLNQARQAVQLAKTKMLEDSIQWNRQKLLFERKINAQVDVENAALVYQNSKVNYSAAQLNLKDLRRQLDLSAQQAKNNLQISNNLKSDFTVKSMVKGSIFSLNVSVGEMVTPQTPIAVLGQDDDFVLKMQVDEYDIQQVQKGQKILVVLNSNKGKVYEAKILKIYPLMNLQTRTFTVEASFVTRPKNLYPNLSFEASIVIQTKDKALLIPLEYLSDKSTVTLKSGEVRKVKTGLRDFKMVEIIAGLNAKDEIIAPAP